MALSLYRTRPDKEISFSDNFKGPDTFLTWPLAMGDGAVDIHTRSPTGAIFPGRPYSSSVGKPTRNDRQALPSPSLRTGCAGAGRLDWAMVEDSYLFGLKDTRRVGRETEEAASRTPKSEGIC